MTQAPRRGGKGFPCGDRLWACILFLLLLHTWIEILERKACGMAGAVDKKVGMWVRQSCFSSPTDRRWLMTRDRSLLPRAANCGLPGALAARRACLGGSLILSGCCCQDEEKERKVGCAAGSRRLPPWPANPRAVLGCPASANLPCKSTLQRLLHIEVSGMSQYLISVR